LQLQLDDFEDDESIEFTHGIIGVFKTNNKPLNSGFCKRCGSYNIIGWGGYGRKVRHMYADTERVRAKRSKCNKCGKTFTTLPDGIKYFKRFGNKDYQEMVDQRCSRGSGYRRLSRRGNIKYCSHVTMWRQMQKVGQQTLDAGKSFSTGVGNFFRTLMFYKNFHFFSSGSNKDKNIFHTMGLNYDSMFEIIKLP